MAVMMKSAACQKMAVRPANVRLPMAARPALRAVRATPDDKPNEVEMPPGSGQKLPINQQEEPKTSLPPPVNQGLGGGVTTAEPATFTQVQGFQGLPEIINGRLAMLGFVAAMFAELSTGMPVTAQIAKEPTMIFLTFAVIIAASLYPAFVRQKPETIGPFNPTAELVNGRAAMIGFASLLAYEFFRHRALF